MIVHTHLWYELSFLCTKLHLASIKGDELGCTIPFSTSSFTCAIIPSCCGKETLYDAFLDGVVPAIRSIL